ncbi:ABC transporter permease [Microbacterium sp. NPDC056234]|uniref:ABC transporter permease n=1 Tax=Microbacterium sp. NPDC056234 TaxID=3345757 RepID=UPI0035E13F3B
MSAALDAPVERRTAFRARWRVAARLASRQVRRTILSSLLITALIALPIAGMTAYAIMAFSMSATAEERSRVELGDMRAWVSVVGGPDSAIVQAPTEPDWYGFASHSDGTQAVPDQLPEAATLLPVDTEMIPIVEGQLRVLTSHGAAVLPAWSGESWDERFTGRFDLVDGQRPRGAEQAMVTPAALDRLGASIGDAVVLADTREAFTIVGTLDAATLADDTAALFLPAGAPIAGETRWYLPQLELSWSDVQQLNRQGAVAYSAAVVLDPPERLDDETMTVTDSAQGVMWSVLMLLAVAGAFAGYVVVMLAGAAFAVAARRQQRSLAVAASVGASAGDLLRAIMLQGGVLGLVGGVSGVVVGAVAAAGIMLLTADGSATQYWGFHVPWAVLAGILVFAVVVGTASAAMPARAIARSDTLSALRGARRPQRLKTSRPVWGSVILLIGVVVTLAAAAAMGAVNAADVGYDSPLRLIPPFGIVIGPILVQLGILLSGAWLLWIASRGLSRLGMAARLASRDAAANTSRTVPAFAAIAATVFIAVFAIGQIAMQTSLSARNWAYQAPVNSLSVQLYSTGGSAVIETDAASAAAAQAVELTDMVDARGAAVIRKQVPPQFADTSAEIDQDAPWLMAVLPERYLLDPQSQTSYTYSSQDPTNPLSVIEPSEIETAIGVELSPAQLSAYRDGAAVVADPRYASGAEIELSAWTAAEAFDGVVPDNIWLPADGQPATAPPRRTETLDAIVLDLPHQPTAIAIAPEQAAELGITAQPAQVIASFAGSPSTAELDRATAHAQVLGTTAVSLAPHYEQGPSRDGFWMIPILIAVAVLVLGASAVALGLARFERRPDDATLSAVGGTRALRRGISFWQGLIIAGLGTFAGAAAGVLPPIGFAIQSRGTLLVEDIPWLELGLLAVALPLSIAVVSWLIPPRAPDLTRRTAIA